MYSPENILSIYKKSKILILGDCMLDNYLIGECNRISPEAPVPIVKLNKKYSVLGGAGNCAANIIGLKAKVYLAGMINIQDNIGKQFIKLCQQQNINLITFSDGRPTTSKTRILGSKQQLLRIDEEESYDIDKKLEDKVIKKITPILSKINVVLLSDYNKGFLSQTLCQKLIKLCRAKKIPIVVDPKPNKLNHYKRCNYITPNWSEAKQMANQFKEIPSTTKYHNLVAKTICETLKCNTILTLSEKGIKFFSQNLKNNFALTTQAKEVFDVSGAGDTVISWFVMGISNNLTVQESLYWANIAAGIVVKKVGTAIVSKEDFIKQSKIIDFKELPKISKNIKDKGCSIVSLNGAFDILHNGHLKIINEAKRQGDVLIIAINCDTTIKKNKGKQRPIHNQWERANMLINLKAVDYVTIFDEKTPINFIKKLKPNVHVNGSEYGEKCIEANTVKSIGAKLHIVKIIKNYSSTQIINKIKK